MKIRKEEKRDKRQNKENGNRKREIRREENEKM